MSYAQAKLIIWNHDAYEARTVRNAAIFVLGTISAPPEDVAQASFLV